MGHTEYRHNLKTDDFDRLAAALKSIKGHFILTHTDQPEIRALRRGQKERLVSMINGSIMESPKLIFLAMADYTEKAFSCWYYKILTFPLFIAYDKLFGGDSYILALFIAVFFIDLIVGSAAAIQAGRWTLRRFSLWLIKLVTYGLCIALVAFLNGAMAHSLGLNLPLLDIVLTVLLASEILSIFVNMSEMGCPVPPVLLHLAIGVKTKAGKKLEALLDAEDGKEDK